MLHKRRYGGLIVLNLVLLAVLAMVTWTPRVIADHDAGKNSVGDYLMVGGEINGALSNGVYVLDQRSGILIGMLYDRSGKSLKGLQIRNIIEDARRDDTDR